MQTSTPSGQQLCACTSVKKLSRLLGRVYDGVLQNTGINITQLEVLRCVARREGEPLVRVAEEMELERTALYRALTPMVRNGWITTVDAKSGNIKTARITPKGRKLLQTAVAPWEAAQGRIVERFGERQYEAFISELYRLAKCAEEPELP